MNNDKKIIRELAERYFEASQEERNNENRKLHIASNDLHMIRPVVLIDTLPWNELNIDNQLTLQCEDPFLRTIEDYMRKKLFQRRYCPADMIVKPYLPVKKMINYSGYGVEIHERTLVTDKESDIISHEYEDQFENDDSIAQLKDVVVTYDEEETLKRYHFLQELVGDILPVKLKGINFVVDNTWDQIAEWRGVTPLLIDLIDRPEFSHALVERLTCIHESIISQYEKLNLFEDDPEELHCTPALTENLPTKEGKTSGQLTRKDVWGRGTAQIFASVSKAMHEEFDIDYMHRTIGTCGLSYYGCCEPLDKKVDILEKIKNLRKISITPWADVDIAAEAIGKKYVLASKPNPAAVAVPRLNQEELKKEIGKILSACKRNNCSCELVLKDISTCGLRPENIFEWEKIVMDMVRSF